jgi:hypothetical protein
MVKIWRRLATVFAWITGWCMDLEDCCAARARVSERRDGYILGLGYPPLPRALPPPPAPPPLPPAPPARVVPIDPEDRARTWRPGYQNTKTARDLRLVKHEPTTRS